MTKEVLLLVVFLCPGAAIAQDAESKSSQNYEMNPPRIRSHTHEFARDPNTYLGETAPRQRGVTSSSLILNGDFEINSAVGCDFNLTNDEFNVTVPNVTAFGVRDEIDVMKDPLGCGYDSLPPQSGVTKLGLSAKNADGSADALALSLANPLASGQCYRLSFFAQAVVQFFAPDIGAIQIGVSNESTEFGQEVFSGTPSPDAWTHFDEIICTPIGALYLTVRIDSQGASWNHIDYFVLVPAASPAIPTLGRRGVLIAVAILSMFGVLVIRNTT